MKKLNEILGTKYPFIQGGMANIATGEFAAACSNAGALGMIATGGWDGDRLRQEIRRAKELTDKPFGVNLMLMSPYADDIAQIILEEGVKVVTTGAGNPGKYIPAWKEKGIKVMPVVAAAVLAKRLERYGVDAIIAEGTESGGHVGEMTTMALVPQVIDAVSVPVVAAGGIAVFFHLEHFERIFNGFGHLTSGITQELIAIVVLAVAAIAFGLWRDAREKQAENEYIELPQAAELPSAASQPEQPE